ERVAVVIQFGCQPVPFAQRIEELHDRHMIGVALAAIGEELRAQFVGQEDHAALLSIAAAPGSLPSAPSPVSGRKASSQSAALLAWEAARTMARLSSRSTSSQEPI